MEDWDKAMIANQLVSIEGLPQQLRKELVYYLLNLTGIKLSESALASLEADSDHPIWECTFCKRFVREIFVATNTREALLNHLKTCRGLTARAKLVDSIKQRREHRRFEQLQ